MSDQENKPETPGIDLDSGIQKLARNINQVTQSQRVQQPQQVQPTPIFQPGMSGYSHSLVIVGNRQFTPGEWTSMLQPHERDLVAGQLIDQGYGRPQIQVQADRKIQVERWKNIGTGVLIGLTAYGVVRYIGVPTLRLIWDIARETGHVPQKNGHDKN